MEQNIPHKHIVILGAGIIGLQTALTLLSQPTHNLTVTVLGEYIPRPDAAYSAAYASAWAGAHWRPHGLATDARQRRWDVATYEYWMALREREEREGVPVAERSGVMPVQSTLMWDDEGHEELQPTGTPASLWFAESVRGFRDTSTAGQVRATFTAVSVDVPKYLPYLRRKIEKRGGRVQQCRLASEGGLETVLGEAASVAGARGEQTVFVNAVGLAAESMVPDSEMYPARGQTVLVRGAAKGCVTRQRADKGISYVIPRPEVGVSILGGSKGIGDRNEQEDKELTATILERCRELAPELLKEGDFEVVGVNVGFRPMRKGGARVEKEVLASGRTVVHAYGVGGAGYQNSVGVAEEVCRMVLC